MTVHVELKRPETLTEAERAAWMAIQASTARLASPYFTLGFFDAVAAVRGDVRVLVRRSGSEVDALLPLQLDRFGHARPLSGPLADHHGLIARDETAIDLHDLLCAGAVSAFDFFALIAGRGSVGQDIHYRDGSWVADLSEGFDVFKARQKKIGGNTFRTIFAARRKLREAGHKVCFTYDDRRPETLAQLKTWKSSQYQATGHFDVFSRRWVCDLVDGLYTADGAAGVRGLVSTLEIDGRLAAAHFGMLSADVLHYWFPAYEPDFAKAAPGNALLDCLLEALCDAGVSEVHLGPGDYRYKAALGSWQIPLLRGFITTDGPAALLRRAAHAVEHGAEVLPLGPVSHLPGKAFRRLDRIAGFRAA